METTAVHFDSREIDCLLEKVYGFIFTPEVSSIHNKLVHAKQAFIAVSKNSTVSPDDIIDQVCKLTLYTREEITGNRGQQELCDTRACISALIHEFCPKISIRNIRLYVHRDNATVHHHLLMVKNCAETKFLYEELKSKIVV